MMDKSTEIMFGNKFKGTAHLKVHKDETAAATSTTSLYPPGPWFKYTPYHSNLHFNVNVSSLTDHIYRTSEVL